MTTEEKKRGRPPIFKQSQYESVIEVTDGKITTKRGMRNKIHMMYGWGIVKELVDKENITGLDYLIDPERKQIYSEGILRELGQFGDKDLIKKIAIDICALQLQINWPRYKYQALLEYCRRNNLEEYTLAIIKETVSEIIKGEA